LSHPHRGTGTVPSRNHRYAVCRCTPPTALTPSGSHHSLSGQQLLPQAPD
jgi:hypothetical protein